MLILRRKKNESFLIGTDIRITIVECGADGVRVAIDAPKHISIIREELSEAEKVNQDASGPGAESLLPFHKLLVLHPQNTEQKKEESGS